MKVCVDGTTKDLIEGTLLWHGGIYFSSPSGKSCTLYNKPLQTGLFKAEKVYKWFSTEELAVEYHIGKMLDNVFKYVHIIESPTFNRRIQAFKHLKCGSHAIHVCKQIRLKLEEIENIILKFTDD